MLTKHDIRRLLSLLLLAISSWQVHAGFVKWDISEDLGYLENVAGYNIHYGFLGEALTNYMYVDGLHKDCANVPAEHEEQRTHFEVRELLLDGEEGRVLKVGRWPIMVFRGNHDLKLEWTVPDDPDDLAEIDKYQILYGITSGEYTHSFFVQGNATSTAYLQFPVSDIYVVVRSFQNRDDCYKISKYSNELFVPISSNNPLPTVTSLRFVGTE